MSSQFDDYRQESQRDFADPIAMTSRATIEGLFGVAPDLLAGEVRIAPGFPPVGTTLPFSIGIFPTPGNAMPCTETYSVNLKFDKPAGLRLISAARAEGIASVTVNGRATAWHMVDSAVGTPRIEIVAPCAVIQEALAFTGLASNASPMHFASQNFLRLK